MSNHHPSNFLLVRNWIECAIGIFAEELHFMYYLFIVMTVFFPLNVSKFDKVENLILDRLL